MSEMVEAVARALCRQYEIEDGFSVEQAERHADGPMRANFVQVARAAIEAMREVPQEMFLIAEKAGVSFATQQRVWPIMIDAALSPASGEKVG